MPLPNPGELRAWDGVAGNSLEGEWLGVEFETWPRDIQDLFRRKAIKLRDDPRVSRLLVVLTDSEHNRGLATEYVELSRMQFPVLPAGVKADFAAEKLPKENGFLLM